MNITQTEKGEQLVSIKISIAKEDYEPKVNDSLKKMRQKANVPGFRPGMVPMGMVKKMYGMQAKMEVLNDLVSESLNKHIIDNNLNLIGYPLSDPDQQTPADLEHQDTMEFWFEAAIRPEIKYDLSNTMVDFYHVIPEEKEIQETIDNLVKRNPNITHPETVEENDRVELKIREAEDGKEVEGGFQRDGFFFDLKTVTAKTRKKKIVGKEVGAEFIFNFKDALNSEEAAQKLLGQDAPADSDYNIIIDDIIREETPELNEEFFKKVFPDKEVADLDAFKALVKEEMEKQYEAETDRILFNKMIDELVAGVQFNLPDAFLKRWIVENSRGEISMEDVEKNYEENYVKGLRWQFIEDAIVKDNMELVVTDAELKDFVVKQIFPGIDYNTLEDDMKANLDKIAANYLKEGEQTEQLKNQLADIKMTSFLKGKMNINFPEISYSDFIKKLEEERK